MINDKELIINDFRRLGILKGDFLFITADLLRVGYFNESKSQTEKDWVQILFDVVGDEGDVIVACYNKTFFKFKKNNNLIFNKNIESSSGALSNILLKSNKCFRSNHPTNSYIGFGKRALNILKDHDKTKGSYQVVEDILQFKPKNLMIGTIDKQNAPMAFHQVQHNLGYNYKHPFCGLKQIYTIEDGTKKIFTRKDIGGCSGASHKLLPEVINLSLSTVGLIGRAKTLVIDGAQAHKMFYKILKKKVDLVQCDDKSCIGCYGRPNNPLFLYTYLLNLPKIISTLFK